MKTPNNSKLIGQTIHDLTVVERVEDVIRPNGKKRPAYLCRCYCGNSKVVESQRLRSGDITDCGCKETKRRSVAGKGRKEETVSQWKAAGSYYHMIGRCYNEKEAGYSEYGGRGITVCDRWRESFWNFLEDMGEKPNKYVIDRIDPNKNYEPDNCRWTDTITSSYNTRRHNTNTSGRTGVYWFKRVNKWVAAIFINNVQTHLGYFMTFEDAVAAREKAEMEIYGEIKVGER